MPFKVFERAHDIAAVVAADGSHEVLKKLRPLAQRCLARGEARALVARRLRNFGFEAALRADRHGHVIAGLGAQAAVRLKRRIERNGAERACHHKIAVGLETGRQRPFHLLVGEDVDVRIDHEHVLDIGERTERGRDRIARFARYALADGDAHVIDTAGGGRGVDRDRLAHRAFERAPDQHLGAQRTELRSVGAAHGGPADGERLEQRIAPARDGGHVEHRVDLDAAVVAEEFAIGSFRLHIAFLAEIAFEHPLGVGGDSQIVAHALDHRHGAGAQGGQQVQFVARHAHGGAEIVDRMAADHNAQRQPLAALEAREIDVAQVAWCDQVDPGRCPPAHHEAAQADVRQPARRIAREIHAGRDIEPAILAMLEMHRQFGEIDIAADRDHLLYRRLFAGDLDEFRLAPQPPQDLGQELLRRHAECRGKTRTARERIADERPSRRVEQDRPRIGVEHARYFGEFAGAAPF